MREDILQENINMRHLNIICHLPLYMLIQDTNLGQGRRNVMLRRIIYWSCMAFRW